MTNASQLQADLLDAAIPSLSARDAEFAYSLMDGYRRYGRFTERQLPHVSKLINRALGVEPKPATLDLSKVNEMFDAAKGNGLKRMVLRFRYEGGTFKVSPAKETSQNAGCLYVKAGDEYLGKVTPQGEFKVAYGIDAAKAQAALVQFCIDPKAAAVSYGTETGECMFCGKELTDARSLKAKYGPVCAGNWGLPWGE